MKENSRIKYSEKNSGDCFDLFIIGGGINGCGIARDAAGRGYSVYLAEKDDLASGTSSKSTKLIHGGLRYLEHRAFGLVREALKEREVLWSIAPHIIKPLRFVLPCANKIRSPIFLRLGLFIYDLLAPKKKLSQTKHLQLSKNLVGQPLKDRSCIAFEYSDCWVDDARLVVLNALDAKKRGAQIKPRTEVLKIERQNDCWEATVKSIVTGQTQIIRSHLIINAAGPWVDQITQMVPSEEQKPSLRLVQGSHIVVPKLYNHDKAYIFQNEDKRIIFAIPFEDKFTLIGTTDHEISNKELNDIKMTEDEARYLCENASKYFTDSVTTNDIIWSFAGVRPLYDDGSKDAQKATRDYLIQIDGKTEETKIIHILGGKITTYRRLAEKVLREVDFHLGKQQNRKWTGQIPLPGGEFDNFDQYLASFQETYPFLSDQLAYRLIRSYGTKANTILNDAKSMDDLGRYFGNGLTEAELIYLSEIEWAQTAEDVLWRRTKLGLHLTDLEKAEVENWFGEHNAPVSVASN